MSSNAKALKYPSADSANERAIGHNPPRSADDGTSLTGRTPPSVRTSTLQVATARTLFQNREAPQKAK